jgi:hypothetical protein
LLKQLRPINTGPWRLTKEKIARLSPGYRPHYFSS